MAPTTEQYEPNTVDEKIASSSSTSTSSSATEDESSASFSMSEDSTTPPRVTEDLFFDMGERWQTAYLENQLRSPFSHEEEQKPKKQQRLPRFLFSRVAQKVSSPSNITAICSS